MRNEYLRDIYFEMNSKLYPPAGKTTQDAILATFRALPLRNFLFQGLRKERRILADGVRDIIIRLTNQPSPEPKIFKNADTKILYIDVDYDPNKLFDLPNKNKVFGPLYASLLRTAVSQVQHIEDLPFSVINDAIATYEEEGFCYRFKVGEKIIAGTKLKGTVRAELSCERLLRTLTLSYRGKALLETVITDQEEIPVYYNRLPDFVINDRTLWIGSIITNTEVAKVDLSQNTKILEILHKS